LQFLRFVRQYDTKIFKLLSDTVVEAITTYVSTLQRQFAQKRNNFIGGYQAVPILIAIRTASPNRTDRGHHLKAALAMTNKRVSANKNVAMRTNIPEPLRLANLQCVSAGSRYRFSHDRF
jgi:hypothetical protein